MECFINAPTREEIRLDRLVSSSIDHICIRARNTEVMSSVITQKLANNFFIACQSGKIAGSKLETDNKRRIEIIDNKVLDRLISSYDWVSVSQFYVYARFAQCIKSFNGCQSEQCLPDHSWLNDDVLAAIKENDVCWARSRRAPTNDQLRSEFRVARNRANAMLRSIKRQHFKGKFAKAHGSSMRRLGRLLIFYVVISVRGLSMMW